MAESKENHLQELVVSLVYQVEALKRLLHRSGTITEEQYIREIQAIRTELETARDAASQP